MVSLRSPPVLFILHRDTTGRMALKPSVKSGADLEIFSLLLCLFHIPLTMISAALDAVAGSFISLVDSILSVLSFVASHSIF